MKIINFIKDYWLMSLMFILACTGLGAGIAWAVDVYDREFTAQILKFGEYKSNVHLLNNMWESIGSSALIGLSVGCFIVLLCFALESICKDD